VIPAYNAGALISDTIRSLLAQTCRPLEIVVVDDGSVDNTQAILAEFGDGVTCIRQANGGLASARHTGIAAAKGDLIALMDADDLCDPRRLEIEASYMAEHPEVLLCSTDFSAFNEIGQISDRFASSYYSSIGARPNGVADIYPIHEVMSVRSDAARSDQGEGRISVYRGDVYEQIALGNFIHPPTVMFRRSVIDQVGNFDLTSRSMCDWEWFVQVARAGQLGYIDYPLLQYRISATQMSSERYWVRRCVDTLDVFERTTSRDADLYRRNSKLFNRKMGAYCVDCADALASEDGFSALKWLWRGLVQYRHLSPQALRIIVKGLMPVWLVASIRRARAAT
jgi:glycosyltransferase involved in cell wall biosynthesis